MNLIIYQMMELQHVFPTDSDLSVQLFTSTAVIQIRLRIDRKSCCRQCCCEIFITAAVKDGGRYMDTRVCRFRHAVSIKVISCSTESLLQNLRLFGIFLCSFDFFPKHMACPGQVDFKNLSYIHTGRNAERIQNQIDGTSVRRKGHIFDRQNSRAYAFVPVAACHFIAFTNLTLLCNIDTDKFIDSRSKLIAVFTGKHLNVNNFTEFTVRHT